MQKITPCLWFDNQAEEAVHFYASIFRDVKIGSTARYSEGLPGTPGTVMTVNFSLFGQEFIALNGGPHFRFNEAVSFVVHCKGQEETDYYWNALTRDGKEAQCGWLKDKFGVSWQIVPEEFLALMQSGDAEKTQRVMKALMSMRKIDIAALERAYNGEPELVQ